MYIEVLKELNKTKYKAWKSLLESASLEEEPNADTYVLIWEDTSLIACGSRYGSILKCIAVNTEFQGEGITASVITALKHDATKSGINHLFLYTKPENKEVFEDLFFYTVAQTDRVLLMEDNKNGISDFLKTICTEDVSKPSGCIVMNCNPFTLGHQYLIETASRECSHLYVFIVSEDKSKYSAEDRLEMAKRGCGHIGNVTVLPTGPYLISQATFPTYFLKDKGNAAQIKCLLDIDIFIKHYVPRFNITSRYVGTEPLCPVTNEYNSMLKKHLTPCGIEVKEFPRLEISGQPISASRVRELMVKGDIDSAKKLLPDTTLEFI